MSNHPFKDALYGQFARIGKAVSSPRRLELLDLLAQGPRTVEVLASMTGQSLANTSHHLKVLREARLVHATKSGLHVTCRLAGDDVGAFWVAMRQLGESRLSDVQVVRDQFLEDKGQLDRVDADDVVRRVQQGEVTVLDVRPHEEFAFGHIPGAVNVPLSELKQRMADLPRDREIVAYCRGPLCVYAIEAVQTLRDHGFTAIRMEEGVPDWRARGLKVAESA
ncbi:MAG: metalloregulator ArsR/SmtB family transcription factor [Rhodobacterales bacterium]|nr:metalloregulator ArsR/SmtB family transcription factor [Rhodobacterales bacterium]